MMISMMIVTMITNIKIIISKIQTIIKKIKYDHDNSDFHDDENNYSSNNYHYH